MAVNKQSCLMLSVIVCLVIACLGLLIGLITTNRNRPNANGQQQRGSLDAPVVSGSFGGDSWQDDRELEQWGRDESSQSVIDGGSDGYKGPSFPWESNVRLPRSVVPIHYDLYLHPELETDMFSGKVSILMNSQEARDHFLVHVKYLDIQDAKMFQGRESVDLMEVIESEKNEFLVFRTPKEVPAGNYTLQIEFKGSLTRGLVGFYKSLYTNANGKKVPIATSKFQPTYARRAFPCFDEPSFKSTFTVTLVRPTGDGYIALSNMPVREEIPDSPSPGLTSVKFQKSEPMVTYLACFIVCDFEYQEKVTQIHNTLFRVYATPTQKDRLKYSLDIGANITDFFESYFEIPYPLPKQDMIAIPDFVSGAMEHWGLITYRETNLLFDKMESSSYNQQRVATVVSHELAHQWFGNLVTLSWWDDLWLNEGFASYIEYKGVANYHPDWKLEDQFLNLDLHPVMELDSTLNSHPIIQPVNHPDQITEIFDKISYSKGASVLRMLEDFMGPEEFRIGIKRFLEKYKYANAVTPQLWTELEGVSSKGLNVTHIMDTWTRQMGFPVITVKRVKNGLLRLKQSRFLLDSSKEGEGQKSPFNYKWDVHITYRTSTNPEETESKWMSVNDNYIDVTVPSGTKWIKFNVDQKGYFLVNYPKEEWHAFTNLLNSNHQALSVSDRANLISDAFTLASSGLIDYSIPLSILSYLKYETEYVPWKTASSQLRKLDELLIDSDSYPLLRKFVRSLVDTHYERLGWNDEGSHSQKSNRIDILYLACANGHPECLKEAGRAFKAWIKNKSAYIPPNLRSLTYKYGMKAKGNEADWRIMLNRYVEEKNAQEKSKLMSGLAWIGEPWVLKQFLTLAKNESIVRGQNYLHSLLYISHNPIGLPIVWDFIREEWPYLVDRFSLNDRTLGRLPKRVASSFATQLQLEELQAFFKKYPDAGAGKRARKQAVENTENNIRWLNRNEKVVSDWLKNQVQDA